MKTIKLFYFDAPMSRGEECRLALYLAGVDFADVRVARSDWPKFKPNTPYGAMPLLEYRGQGIVAQSNAILVLIGREHDLHPKDNFDAARHEAVMQYAEELRERLVPLFRIVGDQEKQVARKEFAASYLPTWASNVEAQIGTGPFFSGTTLQVADLKLFTTVHMFASGRVDHIPGNIFDPFPKLMGLYCAVAADPRVQAWSNTSRAG